MRGRPVSRILSPPDRDPGLDDHSSGPAVTGGIKLPTRASRAEASLRRYPCGPAPREAPIRHCSGWGLPCRPGCPVREWALTPPFHPYPACRAVWFSVALSLGLPPPGVTRHPCFMESGLSSHAPMSARDRQAHAVIQPSAPGGHSPAGGQGQRRFRPSRRQAPALRGGRAGPAGAPPAQPRRSARRPGRSGGRPADAPRAGRG